MIGFATRLRNAHIEAWVDQWEMLPGDSVVDKVWEEGLRGCDAFIVVLSEHSVKSKWVRAELSTALVKRIEDSTRLIPICLGRVDVPEALRAIVWTNIDDLTSYDREFERVVNAIHGQYDKPPLGPQPLYIRHEAPAIRELARIDSIVLEQACRIAIEQDHHFIHGEDLAAVLRNHGISEAQIIESEEVLETRHYGRLQRGWGPPRTFDFEITTSGFEQFAQTCIPGYDRICADVARHLILEQSRSNGSVAEALEQPLRIIDHILEVMKINGLIKYATSKVGYLRMAVHWVSPELRRMLEG